MKDTNVRNDLGNAIRSVLNHALGTRASQISVSIEGTTVTLSGIVHSPDQRDQVETLTRTVPGVSAVRNHVCISLF
jgi:osmotically-inducible protein OsmY